MTRLRCLQGLLDLDDPLDGGNVQGQRKKVTRTVCSDDEMSDGPPAPPQHASAGVLLRQSALSCCSSSCLEGYHDLELACCSLFALICCTCIFSWENHAVNRVSYVLLRLIYGLAIALRIIPYSQRYSSKSLLLTIGTP